MDPIFRRSSLFYVTGLCVYMGLMGRYMLTRSWPVFEVVPLFLPIYLMGELFASEDGERYAFLRTLPVPDRVVVRTKFELMLLATTAAWGLLMAGTLLRTADGMAGRPTFVYVTMVSAASLLLVGACQIGVWFHGIRFMKVVLGVGMALGLALVIAHVFNLKHAPGWPALSETPPVLWLGRVPLVSCTAIIGVTLFLYWRLMQTGIRIKADCEEHLS
ncbi:MAG: ABC-2 transporter permease [Bacteroidales bacterium]